MRRNSGRVATSVLWVLGVATVASAVVGYLAMSPQAATDVPTTEVIRGPMVETLELRGEIRPIRSLVVNAPMRSGELQIVHLIPSGTTVDVDDVIVRFDDTSVQQSVQEGESELEQAEAEIEQARVLSEAKISASRAGVLALRKSVEPRSRKTV